MNNKNLVTKEYLDAKIEQTVNRITNRLAVVIGIATALLCILITFG